MTTKNYQVFRETEHNLHGPNQPDLMSMAIIKDAASLEPPSRLINQELQDESTDESSGYLPRLASVKVLFVIILGRSFVFPYHYMFKQKLDEINSDEKHLDIFR